MMLMALLTAIALLQGTDSTVIGIEAEAKIIIEVAAEYELSDDETRLLCALRRAENGPTSNEWGIMSAYPDHPAHRFKHYPEKSVRCQASWGAGTIKKHYHGPSQLEELMKIWNPGGWQQELKNVRSIMGKFGS